MSAPETPFVRLLKGDCLERMAEIEDGSVDLILCDLPYGTTACAWDTVIPFEPLWAHYNRVCRGAIVLTSDQPFTTALIGSNLAGYRYRFVWDKVNRITGFLNAKKQPLRVVEDILVFGNVKTYNPQMMKGEPYKARHGKYGEAYGGGGKETSIDCADGMRFPQNLLRIAADERGSEGRVHPTQKPIRLMDYLIRTFSNPGETVLDNTMGSGSTGVAAVGARRSFIGIEQDPDHYATAKARIAWALDKRK